MWTWKVRCVWMAKASYTSVSSCAEHSYLATDISAAEVARSLSYMHRHR